MLARILVIAAVLSIPLASGCRTASYAERGAGFGALAGAATGAAIGDNSGNAAAGAVVGSAIGALTGAAVGGAVDTEIAYSQAVIEQRLGRQMATAVSIEDAIAMSAAGLSDEIITAHIRNKGVAQPLEVPDLITLRENGVNDRVIQAMQNAGPPESPVTYRQPTPPPVIVEEHYYGPPVPVPVFVPARRRPVHHHHYHRPRRPGFSFTIRN